MAELKEGGSVLDFCCGSRKCPVLRETPEGFTFEDEGQSVTLTREQAEIALKWLADRLSRR
jgi:hypothetical protein